MSMTKKCCVLNCNETDSRRHYFPKNRELRTIWLNRIGNPKLLEKNEETLRKNYVVCQSHFAPCCIGTNGKLRNFSLPTINLANFTEAPTEENSFARPVDSSAKIVTPEKLKGLTLAGSSSSTGSFVTGTSPLSVKKPSRVYTTKRKSLFVDQKEVAERSIPTDDAAFDESIPSTSTMRLEQPLSIHSSISTTLSLPQGPGETQKVPHKRKRLIQKHLSGNEKILSHRLKVAKRRIQRIKSRNHMMKDQIKVLTGEPNFLKWVKNLNETTQNFFLSQLRNQKLKSRGRRFSVDDKVLALSVFKQSGKAYRYLSRIFSLPSRKTLINVLSKIPLICGINKYVFQQLKCTVGKMNNMDKYCVLMFDEIALEAGLQYNTTKDCIEGFVDLGGSDRRPFYADHALVFLLKGIHKKWKQPICYTFCESTTSTSDLIKLIKDVVRHVRQTGLKIIATISDQGATNTAAVKHLIEETNLFCVQNNINNQFQGYLIDGKEIVHLYDVPHLLKGVRNGLLKANLHFIQDGVAKVASWNHLIDLYRLDQKRGKFSQIYKLTDEHVLPSKIKKIKVKNCSQVFSRSVAIALKSNALTSLRLDPSYELYLDPQASETADLFLFFDELFDSVNGSKLRACVGKELNCAVTQKTKHISFWNSALPILKSMYFKNHSSNAKHVTPSLSNWIFTIHGFLYIWKILKSKQFNFMIPRCFNQDPVENFFSCIRSHGIRNTKPTCSSFISSNKALQINNLVSPHSVGANCEKDTSSGILDNLKKFITEKEFVIDMPDVNPPVFPSLSQGSLVYNFPQDFANAYVAGVVATKILKKVSCENCKTKMETSDDVPQNILIKEREYGKCHLTHPSTRFSIAFRHISNLINYFLLKYITCYNLKQKIVNEILITEDISYLFCESHSLYINDFINISVNLTLFHYIKTINSLLSGKDLRRKDDDYFTRMAFTKYSKKLHTKK